MSAQKKCLCRAAGVDSIGAVELRNALESRTSLRLPATLIFDHPTSDALSMHLVSQLAAGAAGPETAEDAPLSPGTTLEVRQPHVPRSTVVARQAADAVAISGSAWLLPCRDEVRGISTDGIQGDTVA